MPEHSPATESIRALVLRPDAPGLAALAQAGCTALPWHEPASPPAYGAVLVNALAEALHQQQASLLVLPAPLTGDGAACTLWLAGLEAARRLPGTACQWPEAAPDGASGPVRLDADELADRLLLPPAPEQLAMQSARFEQAPPGAPLVSVIVRSMDRPSLAATLHSLALQTWRGIEVLVVQAGGAGHGPLPRACGDLPLRVLATDPPRELPRAVAANLGLAGAHGEFVLFLDDDDLVLPAHLERLLAALQNHPEAPAAHGDAELGTVIDGRWQPSHTFSAGFDRQRLLFENYLPMHSVLFRRRAVTQGLCFDEDFDLFEDWDFWLQLSLQGDFLHVPGVSARYVVSGSGQSGVFSESAAADSARQRLFEKWRLQGGARQHQQLLLRLQAVFRDAAMSREQLELLGRREADLQAIVRAREGELQGALDTLARERADAAAQAAAQRAILQAREQELRSALQTLARERGDAAAHAAGLQAALDARAAELDAALAHGANLQAMLAAREHDIAELQQHVAGLDAVIAARQAELAEAAAQIQGLQHVVAARDQEVANALAEIAAQRELRQAQAREAGRLADRVVVQDSRIALLAEELERQRARGPLQAFWHALSTRLLRR